MIYLCLNLQMIATHSTCSLSLLHIMDHTNSPICIIAFIVSFRRPFWTTCNIHPLQKTLPPYEFFFSCVFRSLNILKIVVGILESRGDIRQKGSDPRFGSVQDLSPTQENVAVCFLVRIYSIVPEMMFTCQWLRLVSLFVVAPINMQSVYICIDIEKEGGALQLISS